MRNIYEKFKTNDKLENDGITIDYGDGLKIRVARAGGANKPYLKAMEKIHKRYRKQLQLDVLSNDFSREIMVEVYAETIVLSWEGVTDPEGKPLTCNKENIIRLFKDLPDLFLDVQEMSSNAALFREHLEEADSKN